MRPKVRIYMLTKGRNISKKGNEKMYFGPPKCFDDELKINNCAEYRITNKAAAVMMVIKLPTEKANSNDK